MKVLCYNKTTNKNGFALLGILLILGIAIIASGTWYFVTLKKSELPSIIQNNLTPTSTIVTATPSPNTLPQTTALSTSTSTANWKTYKDYENNFEFKYPLLYSLKSGGDSYVDLATMSNIHKNWGNLEISIGVSVGEKNDLANLDKWRLNSLKNRDDPFYELGTASSSRYDKDGDKIYNNFYKFEPFQTAEFNGLKEKLYYGTWISSINILLWDKEHSKVYRIGLSVPDTALSIDESNNIQEFIDRSQELTEIAKSLKINVLFSEKTRDSSLNGTEYNATQEQCSSTSKIFLEKINYLAAS